MTLKYFKFYLFISILNGFIPAFGQQRINCGEVNLLIPAFKGDLSARAPVPQNILVYKSVLKPISQSLMPLELRFYNEMIGGNIELYLIKCDGNKVSAERYVVHNSKVNPDLTGTIYKDLGPSNSNDIVNYIYKKQAYTTPTGVSWQQFLSSILIDNHLCELPDQADLDKIQSLKLSSDPVSVSAISMRFEIMIGGRFRSFREYRAFRYLDSDIPAITYYKNIARLITRLIPQNQKVN